MSFRSISSFVLALSVLTLACHSSEPASPTEPERSLRASRSYDAETLELILETQELIEELFPTGLETAASRQFRNVVRSMPIAPVAAQSMAREFTRFVWIHYSRGELSEVPPLIELTEQLLESVLVLVGLGPSVRKSVENAVIAPMGEGTWYVEVTNPGGAPLTNVVLYDTIDAEISEYDIAVNRDLFPGAIVTVGPGGQAFTVELDILPPASGVDPADCKGISEGYCLAYTVQEKELLEEGIYCNRVAIEPKGGLTETDIACVLIPDEALNVRKFVDQASVGPGDTSTWSVEVANLLASPLTGVVIHDTLDASFSGYANVTVNTALFPLATLETTADPNVFRVILPSVPPTGGAAPAGCNGSSAGFCLAYTVDTTAPTSAGIYCNRISGEADGGFRRGDLACISVDMF